MKKSDKKPDKITPNESKSILKFIFLAFACWQIAILLITLISPKVLAFRERFAYNDGPKIVNPVFLWSRANFDGAHYLYIAKNGYGLYEQAFFPFYPRLIKSLTPLFGGRDLIAGLVISGISAIIFLFLFYKIICLDYDSVTAKRSIIFFLIFPTSFFLSMVYTEGLFLMLLLGSFYAGRRSKWLWAGILGFFCSYTRIVGVFIFPALVYEWYQQNKSFDLRKKIFSSLPRTTMPLSSERGFNVDARSEAPNAPTRFAKSRRAVRSWVRGLPILLVPFGLLKYMQFLGEKYNDPLLFFHVQSSFGAGRSGGKLILIYQVFWRYLKMIAGTRFDYLYFAVWLEFLSATFFFLLMILAFRKKIRFSYLIFGFFSYFIPTFSGTFLSLPRFVLTLFPCFILLGMIKNNLVRYLLQIFFGLLFIVTTAFFLRGYWVS